MKSIVGNARGNRLSNVTIEHIGQWLQQIHYPHLQSRSWLKTPNIPHAFTHLIDLMHWLSHFIPADPGDHCPTFRQNEYYIEDSISNTFFDVVRDTFILWNNNQLDQQEKNKERLVNECVQQRVGIAGAKEVARETEKIITEIAKLAKERPPINPQQLALLEAQQLKQDHIKQDQQRYMTLLHEKQLTLQRLKSEIKVNAKQQMQLSDTQRQLKTAMQHQLMSRADFNKLLEKCAEKRNAIKAKHESTAHLKDIEHNKQLNYSRRMMQLSDSVSKLNMFAYDVAEILQLSNYEQLCVDTKSNVFEIKQRLPSIISRLEELVFKNLAAFDRLSAKAVQLKAELQYINTEVQMIQEKIVKLSKECATLNDRCIQLDSDCLKSSERTDTLNQLVKSNEELKKRNDEQLIEWRSKRAAVLELARNNMRLLDETEKEAMELISAKEERLARLNSTANELRELFEVVGAKWEVTKRIGSKDDPSRNTYN